VTAKKNLPVAENAISILGDICKAESTLRKHYLRELSRSYLNVLLKRMPDKPQHEFDETATAVRTCGGQFLVSTLPRSTKVSRRTKLVAHNQEGRIPSHGCPSGTRFTQMQIPLSIVEEFFRVEPRKPATCHKHLDANRHFATNHPHSRDFHRVQERQADAPIGNAANSGARKALAVILCTYRVGAGLRSI